MPELVVGRRPRGATKKSSQTPHAQDEAQARYDEKAWYILDSGSDYHVVNTATHFVPAQSEFANNGESFGYVFGVGGRMCIMGRGTVLLPLVSDEGEIYYWYLEDVLYVPGTEYNMLSVSSLCERGYCVEKGGEKVEVFALFRKGQCCVKTVVDSNVETQPKRI
ncbi:hypothetical protein SLS57_001225 [Botryosphaeria dothidea]